MRALPQLTASNLDIRNELSIISRFNLPLTFEYKNQQIQALTREQIKAAMNRHFTAEGWVSVTVGPSVDQLPLPKVMEPDALMEQSCMPAIS